MGLVHIACPNGSSTDYIRDNLGVPVRCVPTGFKHLHHEALKFGDHSTLGNLQITSRGEEEEILSGAVQTIAWSLHLMYTYLIYHRLSPSIRGPRPMLMSWSVCLLVNIMQVDKQGNNENIFFMILFLDS